MRFCEKHYRAYADDDSGCWKCYDERRKPAAKKGIAKQSPKARKQESDLAKIKRELMQESPVCFSSGETSNLTLSHIIPKTEKAFATYKGNLVLEHIEAHQIWEHDKPLFAEMYPQAWAEKLRRVKIMSREHYEKLLSKVGKSPAL
jgi:5-methylcytosine-specific restriction endonuclease McrA